MKRASHNVGAVLRGVIGLSLGTVVARAFSTAGQLILAFWLSPTEFGYWAAATSAISLLAGLANFGEVNAYLSGRGLTFTSVRRSTRYINFFLMGLAAAVASIYLFAERPEVAVLAFISALTIPVAGSSDLMYATGVKVKAFRAVVLAQVGAAVSKIAVGVAVALSTHSAVALGVSTLVFYAVMDLSLARLVRRATIDEEAPLLLVGMRSRLTWAANSVAMSLPLQIGFLVAQFLASPAVLGLYYMAFQVTLGVTGLVSAPLSRVSLSTLGELAGRRRIAMALELAHSFGSGMLIVASTLGLVLPAIGGLIPSEWVSVVPAVLVMFASMPVRMMGPVVDAFQQATDKWWQSTTFNLIDLVGTAAASCFALTGDVMFLVGAVSLWKIVLAVGRMLYVFRGAGRRANVGIALPGAVGSALLFSIAFLGEAGPIAAAVAIVLSGFWIIVVRKRGVGTRPAHRLEAPRQLVSKTL